MLRIGGRRTIVGLFLENTSQVPEKPFVRFAGTAFSYGDMGLLSTRVAKLLAQTGIRSGDRVALLIGNRPAFLAAFLGVLRLGATVVPLNTQYKPDEVRYALAHARCLAVLTEHSLGDVANEACRMLDQCPSVLIAGKDAEAFSLATIGDLPAGEGGREESEPSPEDLAGIFYTSGTTSRPKGVMISHENMMYSAEVTIKSLGLVAGDVPLLAFPLFHVNSLFYGILTAIVLQGCVGLLRGFSVSAYWHDAAGVGATWTPGITGALIRLLLQAEASEAEQRHTMKFAIGGGFTSFEQIAEFERRFGVRLVPGWSMTETVSLGTLHPMDRPMPVPCVTGIGYPTLGQEIRLVRDDGTDADAGEAGEILYRSPSLFGGYLDDEEATRGAYTADGWFRTGDVAQMDGSGYLSFMDRKKEMIKTKGENVAAAEVERVINQHPAVAESAAIGIPDSDGAWGERIEAYVVRTEGLEVNEAELTQWVAGQLADFKVPRSFHFVAQLPKTALGKIQRQKLR